MVDLSEENIYGFGGDDGMPLSVNCPKCNRFLTAVLLNNKCVINIEVECGYCGDKAKGTDLRAELHGKVGVKER